ncbi:LysR family transcriptional regulator [Granulicoccus phenolivorans]|uniref:LysR family transcriptional regulator n=1 Tax=Granulicoccus phenolivorans TaxID=266854 RepID=UPI00040D2C0D|nr:LysR family transcriptional regulator [Granulicoccus phenolivorans]
MDLQKLEYFLAVAERGSINASAAAMGVAQPTISQALKSLETELGVRLFHRIGRGMVLTSAGHLLMSPARRMIRGAAEAAAAVTTELAQLRGVVSIAVAPGLIDGAMADAIQRIRTVLPLVRVDLIELSAAPADLAGMLPLTHDLLVLSEADADELARLREVQVAAVGVQEYWLTLPPGALDGHAADLPDPLPISAVPELPQIVVPQPPALVRNSPNRHIEGRLKEAGIHLPVAAVVQQREARQAYVLAGVGISFLERRVAEQAATRGAVARRIDPPLRLALSMVYAEEGLSRAGRAVIELIRGRDLTRDPDAAPTPQ